MAYQFESRIRYSEVGEDKKLTLPGLINYFSGLQYVSVRRTGRRSGCIAGKREGMGSGLLADHGEQAAGAWRIRGDRDLAL